MHRQLQLFTTANTHRPLFQQPYAQAGGNPGPVRGEIDLREELDELFFGYDSGIRHGYNCLIRRPRRDSKGIPIPCTCRTDFNREPDPDCSYCLGEGYNWDEEWAWTYSTYSGADSGLSNRVTYMPPGSIRVDYKIFYFRYDTSMRYGDKIVEVKLDTEGNITLPFVRESIYTPQTINRHRSDNSRIEYITVYCREGDALRLDYPNE